MRELLTVAAGQPDCRAYDVAANVVSHAEMVRAAAARVVVFPELSLTGYELDAPIVALDDPRLAPLVEACAAAGSVALAGAPVVGDSGRRHLGMVAVDGTGVSVAYRKMWLGEAEASHFSPGDKPGMLAIDGWRLGLAICKDTGIPQHVTDTVAQGIDAYLAGALERAAKNELPDRARGIAGENGIWAVIASFAGSTGGGFDHAAGRSTISDPTGKIVAQAGPEVGAVVKTTFTRVAGVRS